MTNDDAVNIIKKGLDNNSIDCFDIKQYMAIDMAIKALEQEPSGETVSLEAFKQVMWERDIAIEQLKELGYGFGQKIEPCNDAISRQAVLDGIDTYIYKAQSTGTQDDFYSFAELVVKQLPSVNPQEPCEDAISRQAVIGLIADYDLSMGQVVKGIFALPPVKPQPKTGHWRRISIDKYSEHAKYWYRCDRCGKDNLGNTDWCPNCGCRMVEPQESEEV